LGTPETEQPDLIRYANSAQGLLAQRDLHVLRRFLLDARDPDEQYRRHSDLFAHSTSCLTRDTSSGRVVQARLLGWPIALCMSQTLKVRGYFQIDPLESAGLKAELAQSWADALELGTTDIEIHGLVDVRYLAGTNPLAVQAFVAKEVNGWSRRVPGQMAPASAPSQTRCGSNEAPYGVFPSPRAAEMSLVGPELPVAFVLLAFVRWEPREHPPVYCDKAGRPSARLQSLLQALFTHATPAETETGIANATSMVRPDIRLGRIQDLHDAMTQAQWMQLAWMAQRARKTDCSFALEHRQVGSLMAWSATLTDQSDQTVATLEYSYDGFWRPQDHVQVIADHVSLSQATGQMLAEQTASPLSH
jgi:hypothetical protein